MTEWGLKLNSVAPSADSGGENVFDDDPFREMEVPRVKRKRLPRRVSHNPTCEEFERQARHVALRDGLNDWKCCKTGSLVFRVME